METVRQETPASEAPMNPRAARVLEALAGGQTDWTAPQLAATTGLEVPTVIRALGWLRRRKLVDLRVWIGMDSRHTITDRGRQQLAGGRQLALEGLDALAHLADVRREVRAARLSLADAARDLENAMRAAHDAGADDDAIARASGMPATLVHDIVSR
jgi:hypothetical protein